MDLGGVYKYMKDNTVIANNGVEIYTDDIYTYADEYISTLNNPEDIYKKQCFAGMIKYIATKIKTLVNTDDLVLLDNLWNIYTSLCYKYNNVITIERYCILININRDTFYSWYKGETKNHYCEELGTTRSDTVKKWDRESESSWQDEASTGNPGPMFVLKSRRAWSEHAPAVGMSEERMLKRTAEQIAADYGPQIALPGDVIPDF